MDHPRLVQEKGALGMQGKNHSWQPMLPGYPGQHWNQEYLHCQQFLLGRIQPNPEQIEYIL